MLIRKTSATVGTGDQDEALVPTPFIVGAGRSGTTLLRVMLDAHPDLAIPPETHFIPEVAEACRAAANSRHCFQHKLTSHARWEDFGISEQCLEKSLEALKPFDVTNAFREFYKLYCKKSGKIRWGDKTPPYMLSMIVIQQVLPEAHFVHIVRDGRDAALSIKDLWFGPNSIEEAAQWWVHRIRAAREQMNDLRHYLEVRYEDLVLHTEPTLQQICSFIELPWNPLMLQYPEHARERLKELDRDITTVQGQKITGAERVKIFSMVTKPPAPDRIGRWRAEMSDADKRCFNEAAGEVLEELGYELD